jgi:hypothetical protein
MATQSAFVPPMSMETTRWSRSAAGQRGTKRKRVPQRGLDEQEWALTNMEEAGPLGPVSLPQSRVRPQAPAPGD